VNPLIRIAIIGLLTTLLGCAQKTATPEPCAHVSTARIALTPIDPPETGKTGFLGFKAKAAWMTGWIELRLPETVNSSMGLHFIDHHRPDMPPLAPLPAWPTWRIDESTGAIRYTARTAEGLEFAGAARARAETIDIEFRASNHTDQTLTWVGPAVCLVLTHSPAFNKRRDPTPIHAGIDGQFTSWQNTTPTAQEKGRFPWPLMLTKESARTYTGPRDFPDGAWIVDQLADQGIIARVSADGDHIVAIRWDNLTWLMSNTDIPCLHAGPTSKGPLKPGETLTWQGAIYLMDNKPDKLLEMGKAG
jgi:hypothetical protein